MFYSIFLTIVLVKTFLKNLKKVLAFSIRLCYYNLAVTREYPNDGQYAAVAQLDRVFGYEPKGRGFESLQPYHEKRCNFKLQRFLFFESIRGVVQ